MKLWKGEKDVSGSETNLVTKGHRFGERWGMSFSDSLLWLLWWCQWASPSLSSRVSPLDHCSEGTAACRGGIFQYLMGNVVHLEALDLKRDPDTEIPMGSHNGMPNLVSMAADNVQLYIKKTTKKLFFVKNTFLHLFSQAFACIFCTIEPYYPVVWQGWTLHLPNMLHTNCIKLASLTMWINVLNCHL